VTGSGGGITPLQRVELDAALARLPAWRLEQGALRREFRFKDFSAAFRFMQAVAEEVERQDHHPDWRNSFGLVEVALTTQECSAVSRRDVHLAIAMEHLYADL
jgi:4a-hydroxytetrahydrobiopterin dehydratase